MNQLIQHLRVVAAGQKGKIFLSDRPLPLTSRYHRILWNFRA